MRCEIKRVFSWLRFEGLSHLCLFCHDITDRSEYIDSILGISKSLRKRMESGSIRFNSKNSLRHSEYEGDCFTSPESTDEHNVVHMKEKVAIDIDAQLVVDLDVALRTVRPLITVASSALEETEVFFAGLVVNSAWQYITWFMDTLETLGNGKTNRLKIILADSIFVWQYFIA